MPKWVCHYLKPLETKVALCGLTLPSAHPAYLSTVWTWVNCKNCLKHRPIDPDLDEAMTKARVAGKLW
jgi:hypothetical protein